MGNRIFQQQILTDNPGMAGGATYYDIEDLYQAFKERMEDEGKQEIDNFEGCFFVNERDDVGVIITSSNEGEVDMSRDPDDAAAPQSKCHIKNRGREK